MPVKRISLQLRTKTAEAQSAISDSPSTPPSSSQENSQFKKRDSSVKGRPSRLKPTVPLHMTTRRHKSELESAYIQEETPAVMGSSKSEQIFSISTKRIKISTSEALASDENLKKRARARINGIHNSVPISCAKETSEFHQESVKSTSVLGKRPRGRPPRRPKPSLSIVSNPDITTNSSATSRKGSPFQISQGSQASESLESKSTTSSRAPSETVHLKVPRQKLVDQYHRKQWLAFNFATTEQIRKRQARLQHQYSLLAQLAKKNNTTLIDKSIDILNSISDVDLARTEWVVTILTGLEKAEQARAEQIHFEKKICLMGAFHAYDAERQRIETEYEQAFSEIQEAYLQKGIDQIELIEEYESLHESPQSLRNEIKYSPMGYREIEDPLGLPEVEKLDALSSLAVKYELYQIHPQRTRIFHEIIEPL